MPNGTATAAARIVPTILQTWRYGNLASVAANAVNTFKIEVGNNVHGVILKFNSVVPAPLIRANLITDVATVRAWLNSELIFDRTTTEILDDYKRLWDKYGALAAPLGALVVSFMNSRCPVWDQRRGFALGMLKSGATPGQGPYNTLTMEVTMTAAPATAVTAEVHMITDQYPQEATGLHIRRLRTTRDLLAIGENIVSDLPRTYYGLLGIDIVTAQVMTRLSVVYNNSFLYRDLDGDSLAILMDQAGLTPQAGYAHIPFDLGEDLHSNFTFAGLDRFELHPTFAVAPGAGTPMLTEEIWDTVRE
jgi:hypothetical protein